MGSSVEVYVVLIFTLLLCMKEAIPGKVSVADKGTTHLFH